MVRSEVPFVTEIARDSVGALNRSRASRSWETQVSGVPSANPYIYMPAIETTGQTIKVFFFFARVFKN